MIAAWTFALVFTPLAVLAQAAPPTPTHYVTDTQGVLSDGVRTVLEGELRAYERSTGHQVIVWIGDTTGDTPLEEWTVQAAHQWKIGHKGKDDGAVLFVFMNDHKIRIEVGYGLEGSLTDATSQAIIDDTIRPKMRTGDTDGAVRQGAEQMLLSITPSYRAQLQNPPPPPSAKGPAARIFLNLANLLLPLMVLLAVIFVFIRRVNRRGVRKDGHSSGGSWISSFGSSSSSDDSGGSDADDFSSGGGDFGGGGASGGW